MTSGNLSFISKLDPATFRALPEGAAAVTMSTVQRDRSKASRSMDAFAEGDAMAFETLYDELAPRLYAYVRRLTRVDAAAEDIVQQCFLNIHQARSRFVRGSQVEPWAFAIARRLVIDWARIQGRTWDAGALDDTFGNSQGPEVIAHQSDFLIALRSELELVPEKLREAFLLVRVEGFSLAEAAELLGTTAVAVKLRAHRAGVLLRSSLFRFNAGGDSE